MSAGDVILSAENLYKYYPIRSGVLRRTRATILDI